MMSNPFVVGCSLLYGWSWFKRNYWPAETLPVDADGKTIYPPSDSGLWSLGKVVAVILLACLAMIVFVLYSLASRQDSLLYVPASPIHKIEDNPDRYKNPTERGM